jgi:hypothetical protein
MKNKNVYKIMKPVNWNKIKIYLEKIYDNAYRRGQFKKLKQLAESSYLIINPDMKDELESAIVFPCEKCPMLDLDNIKSGACKSDRRYCSKYKKYKLAKDIKNNFK